LCCFFHALIIQNYWLNVKFCPALDGKPEKGIEAFEVRTQDRQLKALQRKAQKLGFELVEAA